MFYVYRFLDKKNNIIYVGKSKQELEQRFRGHKHLPKSCYDLVYKIEYIECTSESDMSIKEIYYINKYRHEGNYFNVLDTMDIPKSIDFDDIWEPYNGPLGDNFPHSINYTRGYSGQKEIRYNKDGSVDQRRPNKEKGIESSVEGLTRYEVDLIVDYMIDKINSARNNSQEQICFRNLVMFVLSVNLPLRAGDFLKIKYSDLFDENDSPKNYSLQLGRFHKDEILQIPLTESIKQLLLAYTRNYGYSYKDNAEDSLFQSRKHQVVTLISWGRILKEAAEAVGIKKNIGSESTRKTYGLNIFELSEDKFNSLLFLGELWGYSREAKIIQYLNLANDEIDFTYYLGEDFAIGNVDLSKINCLQPCDPNHSTNTLTEKKQHTEQSIVNSQQKKLDNNQKVPSISQNESTAKNISSKPKQERTKKAAMPKERKNSHKWTEEELEVIEKHLKENIPVEILAEEYKVHQNIISCWIYNYKKEMDSHDAAKQTDEFSNHDSYVIEEQKKKELVAWLVDTSPKDSRTNKVWTKEIKLEIVNKNILQNIPQILLAKEYDVPAGNISQWVKAYKKYGESAFEDRRRKPKK